MLSASFITLSPFAHPKQTILAAPDGASKHRLHVFLSGASSDRVQQAAACRLCALQNVAGRLRAGGSSR